MKRLLPSLLAVFIVFNAGMFGESPPTATATSRLPIPATPGKVFDLAWVGKILRISDPRIAPDGKSLAVVVAHPDYDEDIYASDLVLVDTASGKTRNLTHDRKHVSFPRWSPQGDRIAFLVEDAEKHNQIFVLDMAGGESQQVTRSQTSIQQFAWKPDGTAIAFAAADAPAKKTGADKFDDAFEVGDGSFLDHEKGLPTPLWLIPATGGEARRLTSGDWSLPVAFPPGPPASPIAFTPDGNKLVYVRLENTYSGDRRYSTPQVLDIATGKSEPITTHTMYSTQPVPSPDGSHVAYVYPRDGADRNYQDIYVVNGLKGDGDNLTRTIDRNFFRALWMPDSKSVLTAANDAAPASLWIQPLTGSATKLDLGNVTPNTGFWLDATLRNQGQIAFVGTEPHRPSGIYILDTLQSKPRRLTPIH